VQVLFGPGFRDGAPFVVAVGFNGLLLSLDNLLVQFFMAVQDRAFVPILFAACIAEAALITLFHATVGQVVVDVLAALLASGAILTIR
jgi:hypothetical protein